MAASLPMVCICIPTYNASATLEETLDSLLHQTYRDITILVVDNASTDNTVAIAGRYAQSHPNIEVVSHTENIGGEGNFTRCMQLGRGDYTAIYHADDIYEPEMVEKQVAFLEKQREAGAILTGATYIDEQGRAFGRHTFPAEIRGREEVLFDFPGLLKSVLKYSNFLLCPSAMVRTSVYQNDIRIWDGKRYGTSADLDVWLRIAQQHKVGILTSPLMRYRISHHSFSYRYVRTRTTPHDILRVLDDYVNRFGDALLDRVDLKNYRLFSLRDKASRALNAVINGDRRLARRLAQEVFTEEGLSTAVSTPRGVLYALSGCATLFVSFIPLGSTGRHLLYRLKFG